MQHASEQNHMLDILCLEQEDGKNLHMSYQLQPPEQVKQGLKSVMAMWHLLWMVLATARIVYYLQPQMAYPVFCLVPLCLKK